MGDDTFLHPSQLDSVDLTLSDGCNSVLLINESEELFCNNEKEFVRQLKLPEDKRVKVVAIFGNTGEGKSYTLNQTFFDGERVFKTSPAQNPCNIGVWAKYDPKLNVICLDTEGEKMSFLCNYLGVIYVLNKALIYCIIVSQGKPFVCLCML